MGSTPKKDRRAMIALPDEAGVSVRRQCELLGLNRSSIQYIHKKDEGRDTKLRDEIEGICLGHNGTVLAQLRHLPGRAASRACPRARTARLWLPAHHLRTAPPSAGCQP